MNFNYKLLPNTYVDDKKIEEKYKPEISIVMPFFNSGEYIEDTVNSVLNQSYPWFELIIVDDGSKDDFSLRKLKEVSKKDKRIKVFHKENTGLAATRDFGRSKISKTSKYILFLDDDDLIESNYLECCYFALETNSDASFAYTSTVGFGTQEYLWNKKFDIYQQVKENQLVATALIRLSDFDLVNGYEIREKGVNEDWIFWTKLFTKSKYPVKLNYYGFWYRRKDKGELKRSLNNKTKTQEFLQKYIKNVDYDIKAIEYPFDNYQWNDVNKTDYLFKLPTSISYKKENIIMMLPQIVMGGADKFCIDFLKGLDKKYSVTLILTNISDNNWLQDIKPYVRDYYILPSFLERRYWNYFLEYLVKKLNCQLLFNTNSIFGYMCLPYLKSKFPDIKIIDYIHMEEWYNRNGGYSRDSSAVSSIIDLTMTCNKNSENILHDYFGVDKRKTQTVYIGVDEEKFDNEDIDIDLLKEKYSLNKNKKIISFIARISYQKRPFLLAEIIKKFVSKRTDSIFLVCGDGELLEDLKSKIKQENLSNYVKFLGSVKETKEIYAISDVTLNCSIKEGLALTTYESLSMGVPVISSLVGGQAEIIDETVGAVIPTLQKEEDIYDFDYDEEEVIEFVDNLNKVLDNNEYYKKNCRAKILNGFTIHQMNENMNKIINSIIEKKVTAKFPNIDIALELLNQYLLQDTESYQWLINSSRGSLDLSNNYSSVRVKLIILLKKLHLYKSLQKLHQLLETVIFKIKKLAIKLHVYNELSLIYQIIKLVLRIPITVLLIVLYILKIPYIIIKRFINIIHKIQNRKGIQ